MKHLFFVLTLAVILFSTGCQESAKQADWSKADSSRDGELFVVGVEQDQVIKYKLTSQREATLDLKGEDSGKNKPQTMTEKLEVVMAYKVIEADPYGMTTFEATCEKADVTRSNFTGRSAGADSAEKLRGKKFRITITPSGRVTERDELVQLVEEVGAATLTNKGKQGRIKDQDMIWDFVALQWSLWESISTVPNPVQGVKPGQTWQTMQMVPLPMPFPIAMKAEYTFADIMQTEGERKALFKSIYYFGNDPTDTSELNLPEPFKGKFRMRGMFGFLTGYKFDRLEGQGKVIYNLDTSMLEKEIKEYDIDITAAFMLPLGDSVPVIDMKQKMVIEMME